MAFAARPQIESLIEELAPSMGELAGVELEDKGASLTLHYRRMDPVDFPKLRALVDDLALPEQVRMHEGKMVFEFRPKVEWNKGFAIRRILRRIDLSDDAVIFLGDDATDEDVFRELEPHSDHRCMSARGWFPVEPDSMPVIRQTPFISLPLSHRFLKNHPARRVTAIDPDALHEPPPPQSPNW